MRIEAQDLSMDKIVSKKISEKQANKQESTEEQESNLSNESGILKEQLQKAVDSINEIFEINHSELKFVFHEGLEKYFVQLVDSQTEEIVREIPPKKLLDVFYEMQKLVGMIIDEKI